ncbi:MAG: dual specificity protein phosphatase family protein [Candidatus Sungiibacteriota bacterium]|uniref:Dual specificity protein phosphatase family protein n=1 Tax=Candidatus Sungiibacteriota bacterium TaxID=2750080 RepID=A0A7T5RJP4_9BACT|nr:MAG: dual specificity protein phosphatase family protein [Candidatus Sungbacteria bacterium]
MEDAEQTPVISQVLPHLYLGNFAAATNAALLRAYAIKGIISVTLDVEVPEKLCSDLGIVKTDFHIPDGFFRDDQKRLLSEIIPRIKNLESSQQNCLINCWAGKSRSVSLVTAYLVWGGMDFRRAYRLVTSRHPIAAAKPHTMYCFIKHTDGKFSLANGFLVFRRWLKNLAGYILKKTKQKIISYFIKP